MFFIVQLYMSYNSCEEAVKQFMCNHDTNVNVDIDEKNIKCHVPKSKCVISGNTDILHTCLNTPLNEPKTVFSYIQGKIK